MEKISQRIAGFIIVAVSLLCTASFVYAQSTPGGGGNAGPGGGNVGGCNPSKTYGGCYDSKSAQPAFWITIDAPNELASGGNPPGDRMAWNDMHSWSWYEQKIHGGKKYFSNLRQKVRGKTIDDCHTYGGAAYILVRDLYDSDGGWYGLMAGVPLSEAFPDAWHTDDGDNLLVGEKVSWADAKKAFDEGAPNDSDGYDDRINGYEWGPNSELTWFCADYGGSSKKTTTTTTTTTGTWKPGCKNTLNRIWGETTSRIAVRNASLDNTTRYSYNGSVADWNIPSGKRRGLVYNESGWSSGGANVWNIAKPGDSIQFVHEYCVNARYVRKVNPQDQYIKNGGTHNTLFHINTDSLTITAELSGSLNNNFAFGDGISWMNGKTASVTGRGSPDVYPFQNDSGISGAKIMDHRFGIGTLSPTTNAASSRYACLIGQYNNKDAYQGAGTFQIPGWVSGRSCSAASAVGRSDLVGERITQKHVFNRVQAWEQYSNTPHETCGCRDLENNQGVTNRSSTTYWETPSIYGWREERKCTTPTFTCDVKCDKYHPVYKNVCIDGPNPHAWEATYTDKSYNIKYHSNTNTDGTAKKTATVYIPYNFETEVSATINSEHGEIVFQGGRVDSQYDWAVTPRKNEILTKSYTWNKGLSTSKEYATYTPAKTKVQMIEFIMKPVDVDGSAIKGNTQANLPAKGNADICDYYKAKGAYKCQIVDEIDGPQNPTGDYKGANDTAAKKRAVPDDDEYVGYKYCVAVGFYPSDSHDFRKNLSEIAAQYSTGWGGAMDAGDLWNISDAACRTIAKKPTVQVWNGSVYTEGDIIASLTSKMLDISFNNACRNEIVNGKTRHHCGDNYDENAAQLFGSWTDYAVIAKGKVRGMSSGAKLGYNNSAYDLRGSGGYQKSGTTVKKYSPLTIANTTIASDTNYNIANGGVDASSSIEINLKRLYARYRDKAFTFAQKDNRAVNSQSYIRTAETGMQYIYYEGNANLKALTTRIKGVNGANNCSGSYCTTVSSGNNLYKKLGDGNYDNTLVIYVKGDLFIDQNICLGSSCNGTGMKLMDYDNTKTNAASKLPQVLIFANNIHVAQDVTRIDAWLISEYSGKISTCSHPKNGGYVEYKAGDGEVVARDGYGHTDYDSYGSNCYKTLVVNGPVYTHSLILSRNAGSYHGSGLTNTLDDPRKRKYGADSVVESVIPGYNGYGADRRGVTSDGNLGSIAPAEIFNLRSDVYLWAYNQAQRYSEAVVTYMRELAPRY